MQGRLEEFAAHHIHEPLKAAKRSRISKISEKEKISAAPETKSESKKQIRSKQNSEENRLVCEDKTFIISQDLNNIEPAQVKKQKENVAKVANSHQTPLSSKIDDVISISDESSSNLSAISIRKRKKLLDVTNTKVSVDVNSTGDEDDCFKVPSRIVPSLKPLSSRRCIVFDDLKVDDETDEEAASPINRPERFPLWSLPGKRKTSMRLQSFLTSDGES